MNAKTALFWIGTLFIINSVLAQKQQTVSQEQVEEVQNFKDFLTPKLKDLYIEATLLENTTPQQIEANRLAIKNAWMEVDSEKAALYKPLSKEGMTNSYIKSVTTNHRLDSPTDPDLSRWEVNTLVHDKDIDGGVDLVGFDDGSILYASSYQNRPNGLLHLYRSEDRGDSWAFATNISFGQPLEKLELLALDAPSGDKYLLAFILFENKQFRVYQFNLTTMAPLVSQGIATDVVDFTVDRNYPVNTMNQRVFGVFTITNGNLYSARSTAGSYGFDWVDETIIDTQRNKPSLAYGRNGALYNAAVHAANGNLYVRTNTNFNDPLAWEGFEIIEDGTIRQSLDPTIRAERKLLSEDNVLVVCSSRDAGTADNFTLRTYRRVNEGSFVGASISVPDDISFRYADSFIDYTNDSQIHIGYLRHSTDASEKNRALQSFYDGSTLNAATTTSFEELDVFREFQTLAILTTSTTGPVEEPMMVFVGTTEDGLFGKGLYFDKESSILNIERFNIQEIQLFPNPAREEISIKVPSGELMHTITIYDSTGKIISRIPIHTNTQMIPTSTLSKGIYMFTIETDQRTVTKKIIKI
ncbi:T9SS type A sorting domain-containing protein [Rasiella sp. SM2506]|uniref:T9SS type A sorting domain-containing protein n=1 Tax=Rasiella sp. SM2506 TaxID=3423914 RepID=UPI003D7A6BF3